MVDLSPRELNLAATIKGSPYRTSRRDAAAVPSKNVELRSLPYPYSAMLAICSDLDETADADTYIELLRFLNTSEDTIMGRGVGLEVGNTLYFYMAPHQFSYWNCGDRDRERLRTLIRSGHIDCIHSFGDLAVERSQAQRTLEELNAHDCQFRVWVDHAQAPSNLGSDIMRGHGDDPRHPCYHADITRAYGVEYFWRGRVTSVIGQERPLSLSGVADWSRPVSSAKTLGKEVVKQMLARVGNSKYALHGPNRILGCGKLRDGAEILEFLRFNPHWRGVCSGATAVGFPQALNDRALAKFLERGGLGIFYTHLGKLGKNERGFNGATVQAFRKLKALEASRRLLVTTTTRLLDYCNAVSKIVFSTVQHRAELHVRIESAGASNVVSRLKGLGLTFYIPDHQEVRVFLEGLEVGVQRNPPDSTGRISVSFPWRSLVFPLCDFRAKA